MPPAEVTKFPPVPTFFLQAGRRGQFGLTHCITGRDSCVRNIRHRIYRVTEGFLKRAEKSGEPADIARALWSAWRVRDKAATLALLADGIVFALFVPQEVLPFGGETIGKPSVSDRLQTILDQFDTLMYEGKKDPRRNRLWEDRLSVPSQGHWRNHRWSHAASDRGLR